MKTVRNIAFVVLCGAAVMGRSSAVRAFGCSVEYTGIGSDTYCNMSHFRATCDGAFNCCDAFVAAAGQCESQGKVLEDFECVEDDGPSVGTFVCAPFSPCGGTP